MRCQIIMSSICQHSPHLIPVDDGDISVITRATTASTNLTLTNDENDDQSKLFNEQLKRSSLGLARDSLELFRHTTVRHASKDEQIIASTNNKITPHPRKSVLKSHLDSSENLPTPELISYVAIDEVQGDRHLLEKHMQYAWKDLYNTRMSFFFFTGAVR